MSYFLMERCMTADHDDTSDLRTKQTIRRPFDEIEPDGKNELDCTQR